MTVYSLDVKDPKKAVVPHWDKVPWLAEAKKVEFKPGVNIIFGPNGSGKSALIQALAMMKHCKDSGFPVVTSSSIRDFNISVVSDEYRDGLVLHCDDEVARYVAPDSNLGSRNGGSIDEDFGIEHLSQLISSHQSGSSSSGEQTMTEIARVAFSPPKDVKYCVKRERFYDKKLFDVAVKGLKGRVRKNQPKQAVLLLDEVERSLDFVNEAMWWDKINHAMKGGVLQIILATHSPFALALDDTQVNFIETSPGYIEKARKAMNDFGWVRK